MAAHIHRALRTSDVSNNAVMLCHYSTYGVIPTNSFGANPISIGSNQKPGAAMEKPVVAMEKPVVAMEKPVVANEKPGAAIEKPVVVNGIPVVAIEVPTDPSAIGFDPSAIGFDPSAIGFDPTHVACDRSAARSTSSPTAVLLFRGGGSRPAGAAGHNSSTVPFIQGGCCMARFPNTEADVAALAMVLTEGLRKTPELFPVPPSTRGPRRSPWSRQPAIRWLPRTPLWSSSRTPCGSTSSMRRSP